MRTGLIAALICMAGVVSLPGCQTPQQQLAAGQDAATEAALRRGKFELDCPTATATVLSNEMLQPVLWRGIERAEYTIGVEGCGKKSTYVVVCPESNECVAASGQNNVTSTN